MTELGIYADTLCIIGKGAPMLNGYKRVNANGREMLAHRAAWAEANGPIPAGMFICHRCDNPPCVNVDHLFLGTPADNNRDRDLKGRNRNQQTSKTSCPQGHAYSHIDHKGARACRICLYAASARYRARKRLARGI